MIAPALTVYKEAGGRKPVTYNLIKVIQDHPGSQWCRSQQYILFHKLLSVDTSQLFPPAQTRGGTKKTAFNLIDVYNLG